MDDADKAFVASPLPEEEGTITVWFPDRGRRTAGSGLGTEASSAGPDGLATHVGQPRDTETLQEKHGLRHSKKRTVSALRSRPADFIAVWAHAESAKFLQRLLTDPG